MTMRKLTLSVPDKTVQRARLYARRRGTTISALVTGWFEDVEVPPCTEKTVAGPVTNALTGLIASDIDEKAVLEEALLHKHGLRPNRRRSP